MQTKMISVTKASLKINDPDTYIKFLKSIEDAKELTEQKKTIHVRLWFRKRT